VDYLRSVYFPFIPKVIIICKVQAKFDKNKAGEFYEKLTDGTIQRQQPDGQGIIEGMNRAVIDGLGLVRWSEECYCDPPLAHQQATVLDHYFSEIETDPIDDHQKYEGDSFMEYLSRV